jgi:hypothetical protein
VLAGRSSAKSPGRLGRRPASSHTTSIQSSVTVRP